MAAQPAAPRETGMDLREACVREALAIIEVSGLESLSLREVSRRLGVSHQAPYKHFPSRDHILAEIVARAFDSFARYLDEHASMGSPEADLNAMGSAYLAYAREHPLQYQLMFATPLPSPQEHPNMMKSAQHAFALLRDSVAQLPFNQQKSPEHADLEALFIWSTMHGMAGILQMCALDRLALSDAVVEAAPAHAIQRLGIAIGLWKPDEHETNT